MNRYIALDVETKGFSPKNLKTLPVIMVFAFKVKKGIISLNYEGKWGFCHSIFSSCERSSLSRSRCE